VAKKSKSSAAEKEIIFLQLARLAFFAAT